MSQPTTLRRAVRAAACALMLAAALPLAAELANLPTAKINGREMYYYEVSRGESIYVVAHKLGIDREELLRYNPSAVDGLKPRMRLYYPVKEQATADNQEEKSVVAAEPSPMTHIVKKGETLYGISRSYKIPIEQLIKLNPGSDVGVKAGQRLVLAPAEVAPEPEPPLETPQYAIVAPVDDRRHPDAEVGGIEVADTSSVHAAVSDTVPALAGEELDVAVVLPFMLNTEQAGRTSALYTEFYKGLLMAADELRQSPGAKVKFHVYDSSNSADSARVIMNLPEMSGVDLIIAPDGYSQLAAVIEGAPRDAIILNMFNVKDDSYLRHPNVIQTNIPHDPMYDSAIKGFLYRYENYLPVFVSRIGGPADKDSFVLELKERLRTEGRDYREVSFETILRDEDLSGMDTVGRPVVFVPNSGTNSEFAKISSAITHFREAAVQPEDVVVWGYPEWITFRDESFREICGLDATIYSRFFADDSDSRKSELGERFRKEFGVDMVEAVPTQGILGYDIGMYVIRGLREKAATGAFPTDFSGLQSELRLARAINPESGEPEGLYNEALLLIHFHPGGVVEKICL